MRSLLTILSSFISCFCFSQTKLDTSIKLNGHQFRISLSLDESSVSDINSSINIFRDNKIIFTDSLQCASLYAELKDMNGDGLKDLLVYEGSGARANEIYYLFLFRKTQNDFIKVKGFNEWPNLNKTKFKGILVSAILSGTVEYRFFKITNSGKLIDLNISEIDEDLSGDAYKRGLSKVEKLLKK